MGSVPLKSIDGIRKPPLSAKCRRRLFIWEYKAYAMLIAFQKTEKKFSSSTMYANYPINRELMHWESQANTGKKPEFKRIVLGNESKTSFTRITSDRI